MYREMRRKDRTLDEADTKKLLRDCEYGVLASVGADGLPYAVPLSYVLHRTDIYFHCANEGHKIDNIAHNPHICFAVVGETEPVYDQDFTTYFESAVVFGKASLVTDREEKESALFALCEKYLPMHMEKAPGDIAGSFSRTSVYKIEIEHMSGKAKQKP